MGAVSIVGLAASYACGRMGLAEDIVITWFVPIFLILIAMSLAWWLYERRQPDTSWDRFEITHVTPQHYDDEGMLSIHTTFSLNDIKHNEVPKTIELVVGRNRFTPIKEGSWRIAASQNGSCTPIFNVAELKGTGTKEIQIRVRTTDGFYGSKKVKFGF